MPVCVGCACLPWRGGFRAQGQAQWHPFVLLQWAVVLLWAGGGGLCVPGAPGPSSGAWVPYHKAAGGVCWSGDLRLPPTHN